MAAVLAIIPAGIYLLKVNNRNTRTRCEICSKLTIKTPERRLAPVLAIIPAGIYLLKVNNRNNRNNRTVICLITYTIAVDMGNYFNYFVNRTS